MKLPASTLRFPNLEYFKVEFEIEFSKAAGRILSAAF